MLKALKRSIGQRSVIRLGYHHAKAWLAAARLAFPARHLTIIGITGTDGKTTTVGMTAHILQRAGKRCGALSTAFFAVDGDITWNDTQKTSPSPHVIQQFLASLHKQGCTHAVLEYSSHGLVQGRLNHTWPTVAGITNTSMEHLDYHGSMERYRADKAKLFRSTHRYGAHVLNADDDTFQLYSTLPSGQKITYAAHAADEKDQSTFWLSDITETTDRCTATLHHIATEETWPLHLSIPGRFNLENALCAIGCAHAIGVHPAKSCEALVSYTGTPGRMEQIDEGQAFSVFVDFTVTPGAYQKTLTTLRSMIEPGKRVLVLTGSCGDRMREKRPEVGRICSELADVVVVANEDPYTEDPQQIINEVWSGIDQGKADAHQIFDRREAIEFLLHNAQPGDAVILCGKGSDTTMWTAEGQVPWDEREIVCTVLRSLA